MAHDLHLPASGPPGGVAVVVHPHPAMGGDRHHPVVVAIAEGLADVGIAALRPDLTVPDPAHAAAALEAGAAELATEMGVDRIFLVGYSWGSVVSSLAAPRGLVSRVLIAPPVSMLELSAGDGTPTLVLVPEHDHYGGPAAVTEVMGSWPATTIEVIEGADHFLVGAVPRVADRTAAWCRG
jgi:alpha/beta superfamily hydrolase